MMLPSKELLKAVLGDDYKDKLVDVITLDENNLVTYYDCGSGSPTGLGLEINIYELQHKMKEWTLEQGYLLVTKNRKDKIVIEIYDYDKQYEMLKMIVGISEQQAVFDACEWILKNKDKE